MQSYFFRKIYLELNEAELCLPSLLVDQVVVVLGWDVERVTFLRVELKSRKFSTRSCEEELFLVCIQEQMHENRRIL